MSADHPPFKLEFYVDEHGTEPVREWAKNDLTPFKRRALGVALHEILAYQGVGVCGTDFGKQLGSGIFEFRLRHSAAEILKITGKQADRSAKKPEKILLRVFCHAHGNKMVLLLGGYDKGRDSSDKRQQSELKVARQRLSSFKQSTKG